MFLLSKKKDSIIFLDDVNSIYANERNNTICIRYKNGAG